MDTGRAFTPSEKLRTKFYVTVWTVFLLCVFPFVFLGFIPDLGWTYVGIFLAANVVWIVIAYILIPPYYRSISYELGDEEVIVRKGIITKVESIVPYRMVTNVSIKQGLLDRWLGMGGLEIHTAGFSQQVGAEAKLSGLEDYERVHEGLTVALHRYREETGPSGGEAPLESPAARSNVSHLLQQILDELRALRAAQEQKE